MNSAFAVWASPVRSTLRLSVSPEGVRPEHGTPVSPYIPLAFAEAAAAWGADRLVHKRRARSVWRRAFRLADWSTPTNPVRLRRQVQGFLLKRFPHLGPSAHWRWPALERTGTHRVAPDEEVPRRSRLRPTTDELDEAVCEALSGRTYTGDDVVRALSEAGIVIDGGVDAALAILVCDGNVRRTAAVSWVPYAMDEWRCVRCGMTDIGFYTCYRCGLDACPQCDTCVALGRMTGCTALYRRPRQAALSNTKRATRVLVRLSFPLTPQQHTISKALVETEGDALVWAACGAGKTEVTYETIRRVVAEGGRALFAVPRRDVVEQLGRRLSEVFTGADVAALYGGTPERYTRASIVVSTVHQTLRFHQAFDVAIIDEVDAFPMNKEPWLLDAVEQALRPKSRTVAMSATPSPAVLRQTRREDWSLHVLPARPHGHPLPVPEVVEASSMKVGRRTDPQRDWLAPLRAVVDQSVRRRRRVLVFVPSVSLGSLVAERVRTVGETLRVTSVHAGDAERSEKLSMMEAAEIDVLVSTTVLERGVTLPYLDVVVFAADSERVWDAASLIQMAGRVGRSPHDPSGRVVYLAARTTPAMKEATATILQLNQTALELGLLRADQGPET